MSARLDLTGLTAAPSQVWGGVRLVPLVRDEPITDLRLHAELYGDGLGVVAVDRRTEYWSYIPHGFVATWSGDDFPSAAYGTSLGPAGGHGAPPRVPVRAHRRMARRTERDELRFLPLHLALEGYLALHFGGPTVVWDEWSQRAVRNGLSPREEQAYGGAEVRDLADALKLFEIHPGQCGVVVHLADALAAAFVVPHPDDYRALHATLVQDMYGEIVYQYATYGAPVPEFRARLDGAYVRSLADLRAAAGRQRAEWSRFHDGTMAAGLLDASYSVRRVHRLGNYELSRFLPAFRPRQENHIGELITDHRGRTAYLKTFRLSETQARRGHLLSGLGDHDWHLPSTAAALGLTEAQFGLRLDSAGLGFLLREDVLAHYRASKING
ncbi:ARPP-2 domain-containing protein [Saccharothrix xinjiangensis]|uniref:ARG and Rhodanese-Phosphatase-superfamily-associated domain-containing protein n=1 Tax=Saccharothrix xinjiangensis TaxID=204798 RepID=A0ABV9Y3U1_9PSEU